MILNLRGPSGSGKSYLGHQLLEAFPVTEVYEDGWLKSGRPKLVGYDLPGGLQVLGSYRAAGGGVDTFIPHDRSVTVDLVRRHARERPHLFFEGLVLSSTVLPYIELSELFPGRFVFAFMDTPPDLCVQRVYQRNGGRPIKEKNVHIHAKRLRNRVCQQLTDAGCRVEVIDHTKAFEQVIELFRSGGWRG